jgi:hypothetical protein
MKILRTLSALVLTLFWASASMGAEERIVVTPKGPREPLLDLRLGGGLMISPELPTLTGSAEIRIDRFFSLGPMFQYGFDRDEKIAVPSMAVRFIVPVGVMRERVPGWPGLEFSLHTGFGAMIRTVNGFRFTDFAYQAGLNADYYVIAPLTIGLGGMVIVTSNSVERSSGLFYATIGYHY